jgi:hypothetical protein
VLKIPAWLIEKILKAGNINPADVWQQMNVDDLIHLIKEVIS